MISDTVTRAWNEEALPPDRGIAFEVEPVEEGLWLRCCGRLFSRQLPPLPPGPTPRLWEHEVVEFFFGGPEGYTEVELSPFGNHLVLRFREVRKPFAEGLPLLYAAEIQCGSHGRTWSGRALLPWAWVPEGPNRMNVCAIQPGEVFAQWSPAGGEKPDFHDARRWREVSWSRP